MSKQLALRCLICQVPLIGNNTWRKMSDDEKSTSGAKQHRGRGLCCAHYEVARKRNELLDHERLLQDSDSVLEDAIFLVDVRGYSYKALPGHFGMTREAFSRMVHRHLDDERAQRLHALNTYATKTSVA